MASSIWHRDRFPEPRGATSLDPLRDAVAAVSEVLLSGAQVVALAEVVRCARGVVQTADREKIGYAVVRDWWDALCSALEEVE